MSNAQKLALRLSEIRQKLNELSGKDELTDTEQNDMRSLTAEFPAVEELLRSRKVTRKPQHAVRTATAKPRRSGGSGRR